MKTDLSPRRRSWGSMASSACSPIPFLFPTWWMVTSSVKPITRHLRLSAATSSRAPSTGLPMAEHVHAASPSRQRTGTPAISRPLVTVGTMIDGSSLAGYAFARIGFPGANLHVHGGPHSGC